MRYLTTLVVPLAFAGCTFSSHPPAPPERGDPPADEMAERAAPPVTSVRIEDAWLGGEMADLGSFEGDAYEVLYGRSNRIELHAGARGGDEFGWAMLRLTSFTSDFEGAAFAVDTDTTGSVDAIGCTGPEHGRYVFDGGANSVRVRVEPGPDENSRLFHVRAEFDGQGYTEGGFVLYVE